jgi:hypothetical protein
MIGRSGDRRPGLSDLSMPNSDYFPVKLYLKYYSKGAMQTQSQIRLTKSRCVGAESGKTGSVFSVVLINAYFALKLDTKDDSKIQVQAQREIRRYAFRFRTGPTH